MKGCERSELLCPGKRIGLLLHKTAGRGGNAAPARCFAKARQNLSASP